MRPTLRLVGRQMQPGWLPLLLVLVTNAVRAQPATRLALRLVMPDCYLLALLGCSKERAEFAIIKFVISHRQD